MNGHPFPTSGYPLHRQLVLSDNFVRPSASVLNAMVREAGHRFRSACCSLGRNNAISAAAKLFRSHWDSAEGAPDVIRSRLPLC